MRFIYLKNIVLINTSTNGWIIMELNFIMNLIIMQATKKESSILCTIFNTYNGLLVCAYVIIMTSCFFTILIPTIIGSSRCNKSIIPKIVYVYTRVTILISSYSREGI